MRQSLKRSIASAQPPMPHVPGAIASASHFQRADAPNALETTSLSRFVNRRTFRILFFPRRARSAFYLEVAMSEFVDLAPGVLFAGEFRVVRRLSTGGMGSVYLVEQVATGALRALKTMRP